MKGLKFIQSKQRSWANRKGYNLIGGTIPDRGEKNYLLNLPINLFNGELSTTNQNSFNVGDGNETKDKKNRLANMKALHSSSAIVVNLFQYWQGKGIYPISYACKLCSKYPNDNDFKIANIGSENSKTYSTSKDNVVRRINFEEKFKISDDKKKFPRTPNIDIVIDGFQNVIYAIESKFTEPYSGRKKGISQKYIDEDSFWGGISELKKLAFEICPNNNRFKYLDAAQLIKHILGLMNDKKKNKKGKSGFRLLYLWYDVVGKEGDGHRIEIEQFAEIAKKDNIKFSHITYQEVIIKLSKDFYNNNEEYFNYFTDRYL